MPSIRGAEARNLKTAKSEGRMAYDSICANTAAEAGLAPVTDDARLIEGRASVGGKATGKRIFRQRSHARGER